MKKNLYLVLFWLTLPLFSIHLDAQEAPLWLRYPAISPDGQRIVFAYKGDIFQVAAQGGQAYPLTLHEAHDFMPVWSHDGQYIAFASDRFGNYDVYLIPAQGGAETRLTYHSASDYPYAFSKGNDAVYFGSSRLDAAENQQFPSGVLAELYQVPIQGGMPKQVLTTPAEQVQVNKSGTMLVFHDRKGYEDAFRKHHTSSVTRDVWSYDLNSKIYKQLSSFEGEDRNPIFAPDQQHIYYLSEAQGDFNIFKMPLSGGAATQLTQFKSHPARFLSSSDEGLLCFSWNGEIYTFREGEQPQKVNIQIATGDRYSSERLETVNGDASEMALSPNGKEVAFVHRGEVFVSSVSKGTTRRITNTPEQERSISFSPDGRAILYAGERNGSWNVYQTKLVREEEPYFFQSTLLKEEVVVATPAEEFQPAYSPDGKEVAYLEERTALKVIHLPSKAIREILPSDRNYSYSDGDQHYQWSPDGKWFLLSYLEPKTWNEQAGLVSSKGGELPFNLTKSGYANAAPRWMMDGKMMIWYSDRDGQKNHGSWGGESDVYGLFFDQKAYDRFKMSEEDYQILKEQEKKEKEEKKEAAAKTEADKKTEVALKPIQIELDGIEDRKVRLTIHSSDLAGAHVSKDGEKLYYLTRFEKGFDLWQTELRTKETKVLLKLGAKSAGSLSADTTGKYLFFLADGKIQKVELESAKKESVDFNGEMTVAEMAERAYLFEHAWRQVDKKFYKTDLHEINWDFYRQEYARFLPHINNNADFAEMLSEMLGELNASHTGGRYSPKRENPDETAALGLFYDQKHTGPGLKIAEVMDKSPVLKKESRIKAGVIIEKIDGNAISANENPYRWLNRKTDKPTLLSLYDPASQQRWDESVKPISQGAENQLRYERWVENCRQIVDSLSGGRVGYVHVRGMNDASYRTVYEDVLGKNADKDALVVDTRFNGGGWLHDDLATFLSGKQYIGFMPRGQDLGTEPQFKWKRPSVVVMSESNYSDAHMFPFAYRELGIGKLVGMPVPGTGTAVWWEQLHTGDLVFGIPQVGMLTNDGQYLENTQLEPDIKAPNDPGIVSKGGDQQLEAAVKELLEQLKQIKP